VKRIVVEEDECMLSAVNIFKTFFLARGCLL
jgi:hypothetical protein